MHLKQGRNEKNPHLVKKSTSRKIAKNQTNETILKSVWGGKIIFKGATIRVKTNSSTMKPKGNERTPSKLWKKITANLKFFIQWIY